MLLQWQPKMLVITFNNEKEFALHKEITSELEIYYFFVQPLSKRFNRAGKRLGFLSPKQVYLRAINNNGSVAFMT